VALILALEGVFHFKEAILDENNVTLNILGRSDAGPPAPAK
jgi:hypothetical protein